MIICDKCGKENDDNRFICWDCGRELMNRNQHKQEPSEQKNNEKQPPEEKSAQHSNLDNCLKCGNKLIDGASFCNKCGIRLGGTATYCSSCGEENVSSSDYCKKCGKDLGHRDGNQRNTTYDQQKGSSKTVIIWVIVLVCIFFVMSLIFTSCAIVNFAGYGYRKCGSDFDFPSNEIIIVKHI